MPRVFIRRSVEVPSDVSGPSNSTLAASQLAGGTCRSLWHNRPVSGDEACIFCEIVAGKAPASHVYTDELVAAFMTIGPVTEGHLLVVPREHLPYLCDLPEETASRMFLVAQKLAAAIRRSALRSDGINLFYADGEAAFQEVFHGHLHVFPRYKGDSFKLDADWTYRPHRDELDTAARAIRTSLEDDAHPT